MLTHQARQVHVYARVRVTSARPVCGHPSLPGVHMLHVGASQVLHACVAGGRYGSAPQLKVGDKGQNQLPPCCVHNNKRKWQNKKVF